MDTTADIDNLDLRDNEIISKVGRSILRRVVIGFQTGSRREETLKCVTMKVGTAICAGWLTFGVNVSFQDSLRIWTL